MPMSTNQIIVLRKKVEILFEDGDAQKEVLVTVLLLFELLKVVPDSVCTLIYKGSMSKEL